MLRLITAATVGAAALAVSSCGSGDSAPAATSAPGTRPYSGPGFSLAIPKAWTGKRLDSGSDSLWEVRGTGTSINRVQLRIETTDHPIIPFKVSVDRARVSQALGRGGRQTALRTISVAGADEARRIEWDVAAGGRLKAAHLVAIIAQRDDKLVQVVVGWAQGDPQAGAAERALRSVRLT